MKTQERTKDMRLVTWNVRSLYRTGGLRILTNELQKCNIDIAAIQETNWNKTTPTTFTSNKFNIYTSSNRQQHVFGTAFAVARKFNNLVLNFTPIDERLCVLRVKGRFFNYSLINVHAPTNDSTDEVKDVFYEGLRAAYEKCPKHDVKMIIGDVNAKVGREEIFRPVIGKCGLHENTNENGLRLVYFATEMGMVIKSTWFMHKKINLATWKSPDGKTLNQIDHCLIDGRHSSDVINVKTCRGPNVDSDHFMVLIVVRARICLAMNNKYDAMKRYAVGKLKDKRVAETYATNINRRLTDVQRDEAHTDPVRSWSLYEDIIKQEAVNTIGFDVSRNSNTWFDDECLKATEEKNHARMRALNAKTREEKRLAENDYVTKRRCEKKLHRQKKNQLQQRTLADLEQLHSVHETRKFYKNLNASRSGFNPIMNICRDKEGNLLVNKTDVLSRWRDHFDNLLNGNESESERAEVLLENDDIAVDPPTKEEVYEAVKSLKNSKAAGPDGIPAELLKHAGDSLITILHEVILSIWTNESLPLQWMEGALCPLYKKGDRLLCENYRGICLLNTAYKVFARILYNKLTPYANAVVGEYQCGFRRDRSTSDQMFNVRLILQQGKEFNFHTHHLFIDFKAAYDSIHRDELYKIMKELGFPVKLIKLVAATLNDSKCCVKLQNDKSPSFTTHKGLKQGDALSTLLFNVVLEGIVRRTKLNASKTLATSSIQLLAFADDIDIVGRTEAAVKETYVVLREEAAKVGLMINEEKTKYMTTRPDNRDKVEMGGQSFETVNEFVYLGALIRCDNDNTMEIKRRIMLANRCFYGLKKHLRARQLTKETKCAIYKTIIRPVLTYGSESWPLTKADENLLLVFERKVLRTIFGAIQENGVFRRRFNFELQRDYGEANIIAIIKTNRLRWAGHLARMEDERPAKTLFRNVPAGRRSVGRPKMRWIDGVQSDLRALDVRNWTAVAADRQSWNLILDQAKSKFWM